MDRLLVDSGFLVAYARANDPLHRKADIFLKEYSGRLITVAPSIVETCFFLVPQAKQHLLDWVHEGSLAVLDVPVAAYPELSLIIGKYADRNVDFADAALVWLAGESGLRRILTVDRADFSLFRLKGGKRFDVLDWF